MHVRNVSYRAATYRVLFITMIIWMSSLCLCVVFRPGLWPTNTGYCFVSVKRRDGVREGNADQAKNQRTSVRRRRATEQNHVLIQTMPPSPISSKAVTSGNTLRALLEDDRVTLQFQVIINPVLPFLSVTVSEG